MSKPDSSGADNLLIVQAESVWESLYDAEAQAEVQCTESDALLLNKHHQQKQSYTSHDKTSDAATADPEQKGYLVTNQQTQQYWGRFNDPQVSATYTDEPAVATAIPDDRMIRMFFIRKIYSILSAQLLITFAVCAFLALNEATKQFVIGNMGLYWFNFVVCFGIIIALSPYKRSYPTNYLLLGAFTVSMATMVGMVTVLYADAGAGDLVLEAVALTASVFIALTIFTLQTKWDFSFMGAGLGMCLWVIILWGLFAIIFGMKTGSVYALAGSIIFSGFIIYDTYMIAERLDPEDYVVAAIELYLDLVNLFLFILQLLSESSHS